jgi:phage terminase large subunit
VTAPAVYLLEHYRQHPVAFCCDVLGFEPWSKQREVLESVRDSSRTAVRSCHAAGKTAVAARAALWFLAVHPNSRVVTTAPTWQQVSGLLWREIRLAYQRAGGFIGGEIFDTRLELGIDWLALGLSSDRGERFQGHHAEHLLIVVDEASGVEQQIYEALEGSLTSPGARLLLIGNPTQTSGEFFNAFHSSRRFYNCIHVPASVTPNFTGERVGGRVAERLVSKQWVRGMRAKWGPRSPLYAVRVEAEFPGQSDDSVISLAEVEAAQSRSLGPGSPLVLAVDVARFGSDETVIALRRGNVVRIAKSYGGRDLMHTSGEVIRLARELRDTSGVSPLVVIDDAGLGGGVTDRLREVGEFRVYPFLGAESARRRDDYPNRRSESWFALAEMLGLLDIDSHDELAADLLAPRYRLDGQGRRVVEAKSETKRRLRRSPDRGDAVCMAFSVLPPAGTGRRVRPARVYSAAGVEIPSARSEMAWRDRLLAAGGSLEGPDA